ncbi:MAG: tetratricopeptide repeat protein, partial [Leptolyngbyaceae cyanobacterium RM2_2_4]|nr:tetratricopeptide repeat protein [Leptolyngbyaceae cyanobacterium RM2_2_4]
QGDLDQALASYQRGASAEPDSPEAQALIGSVLLEKGDYLRAIVAYRRVVELSPQNPEAFYELGVALRGRDRTDERSPPLNKRSPSISSKTMLKGWQRPRKHWTNFGKLNGVIRDHP